MDMGTGFLRFLYYSDSFAVDGKNKSQRMADFVLCGNYYGWLCYRGRCGSDKEEHVGCLWNNCCVGDFVWNGILRQTKVFSRYMCGNCNGICKYKCTLFVFTDRRQLFGKFFQQRRGVSSINPKGTRIFTEGVK